MAVRRTVTIRRESNLQWWTYHILKTLFWLSLFVCSVAAIIMQAKG